ncbi:MAG: glutathione binding-like protein, partial [Planctomycetota bacterium]
EFRRSQATLMSRMGNNEFLLGDRMTVPDIILTHCMNWAMTAKFPISEARLEQYTERMRARPAYQSVVSL